MVKIRVYCGLTAMIFLMGTANGPNASLTASSFNTLPKNTITASSTEGELSSNDALYDLDKKYKEDIDKTNGVTLDMVDVSTKYSELWKQEMNNYYSMLNNKMDENGKNELSNSQKAWESYIDLNNQLELLCNSIDGGGSSITLLEADLENEKYRDRTIELADLYYGKEVLKTSNENAYGNDSYDLDKKFNEEINNMDLTTDKSKILLKYSALWKSQMNQYYNLMTKKMDAEDREMLANCQKAWEAYSTQNNQLILYCNSLFHYNKDANQETAKLEYQKFRERSLELMDLNSLF